MILAAYSLGSTQILLRSRGHGLPLSPALGTRFSTNGDLLGLSYNTRIQSNIMGFGGGAAPFGQKLTGPTITTAADYRGGGRAPEQRFMIEDAAIPSVLVDAMRVAMPLAAAGCL
ncbi:hypothetical protein LP420_10985 [Massilia sp. B-10]|nr:hypothetical protein LP420_10985 [Massilia sp. B-10]